MNILILGPPGTGKGTQAKLVAGKYSMIHFCMGDLVRASKRLHDMSKSGEYVPDDIILKEVSKYQQRENLVLDGFPRTVYQAQHSPFSIDRVVYLDSDEDTIVTRLLSRAKIEGREDDTEEVIRRRFEVYETSTKPLLDFYKDKLVRVNGNGTIDEVFNSICRKVFGE